MRFRRLARSSRSGRYRVLVCLLGTLIVFADQSVRAEEAQLDHLQRPAKTATFVTSVRSMAVMDQVDSPEKLRERTAVLPGLVLGDEDVFLYLEQSVILPGPQSAGADRPGFRVVEVRFRDDGPPTRRELLKRTFSQSPPTAAVDRNAGGGVLRFSYRKPESPLKAEWVSLGYNAAEVRFEPLATPDIKPGWQHQRRGDGTLTWQSLPASRVTATTGGSPLVRSYRLARDPVQGDYMISAELSVSKGTWAHTMTVRDVPLPLEETLRNALTDALGISDEAATVGDRVSASASLLHIPFRPVESSGSQAPPRQEKEAPPRQEKQAPVRQAVGLVIDVKRLERAVFTRVIEALKLGLTDLERVHADQRPIRDYVALDADLTVLEGLSRQIGLFGDTADGIRRTRSAISGLVFRLPVDHDGWKGSLLYSPGQCGALLVPEGSRWLPSGIRPLQFQAPNDRLVFSMTLQNSDALLLSEGQLDALKTSLAGSLDFPELLRCQVMPHPPAGTVQLNVVDQETDVNVAGIGSLKVLAASFGANGALRLVLSIREAEANRLSALYLTRQGIPMDWNVAPVLIGSTNRPAPALARSDAVVRLQVAVPDGFDLVADTRSEVDVTFILSESFKAAMTTDSVEVAIAYGDDPDRERTRSVLVGKEPGEAVLRMPVRFSAGRLSAALYYSVDAGESWVLSEDGLYGIVFIDLK